MPRTRKPAISAKNIQGLKYFNRLQPLFASLHDIGVDPAGNRQLHYDQYASLILLFFFNPTLTSLRGLQQASCLEKVQDKLDCPRTSLGALSAAARAFDAEALQRIIGELAQEALPLHAGKEAEILRGLTAVDGSLLPALPKMAWALWLDEQHRAAKLHLHFDVFKGVPCYATVTDGNGNEKKQLHAALQSGRLYVIDRAQICCCIRFGECPSPAAWSSAAGEGCCALSKFPSRCGSGSDSAVGEAGSFAYGVPRPNIFLNPPHLPMFSSRSRVSPLSSRPIAR